MTLAIAVVTPRVACVAADRRYSGVGALRDTLGTKLCRVDTSDSNGFMTYAGVGARAYQQPLEVSRWLTNVLRGYNRTLEQTLEHVRSAATRQGLLRLQAGHSFLYAGFRNGQPTIQMVTGQDGITMKQFARQRTLERHALQGSGFKRVNLNMGERSVATFAIGSGAPLMDQAMVLQGIRSARRLKHNYEEGGRLATVLSHVIRAVSKLEPTVGPEVVCAWTYAGGGGSHVHYDSQGRRAGNGEGIPSVERGFPMSEMFELIAPMLFSQMNDLMAATEAGIPIPQPDMSEVNEALRGLKRDPNEKF